MSPSPTPSWERRARAAEKTVDILKTRVRSLYNEGAQTAIHQQLDRAQRRQEEALRRRAMAEARSQALQKHSERLEAEVEARTRHIRTILDNVIFGFAIVGREGTIRECTRSTAVLTGRPVAAGDSLLDVLGVGDTAAGGELLLGLDQVFEDFLPEELTLAQIPWRFAREGRVLKLEGRVIRDAAGAVDAILFTLSDISDLEAARIESRKNAVLVGILRQKSAFVSFVEDARGRLAAAAEGLADAAFVRRAVHTVKGNAASYGLDAVARVAHAVEAEPAITAAGLDQIRAALEGFLADNEAVLGLGASGGTVEVPAGVLVELRTLLNPLDPPGLARWGAEVVKRPARELVGPVEVFVDRLTERLGRRVDFSFEGADVTVDPELLGGVLRNLSHLIRNAVDHGLEPPEERGDKAEVGQLRLSIADGPSGTVIAVEDDGRGIDVEAVVEKAISKGHVEAAAAAALSRSEKLGLIFLDGLSSKAAATDISGRGVGMSAVREAVRRAGGRIDIQSTPGRGTRIALALPPPEALAVAV